MLNILNTANAEGIMPRLTSLDAGRVIDKSDQTIRRHVHSGNLKAWREGPAGKMWIEVDDLREFAALYSYRFNAELAAQLAKG